MNISVQVTQIEFVAGILKHTGVSIFHPRVAAAAFTQNNLKAVPRAVRGQEAAGRRCGYTLRVHGRSLGTRRVQRTAGESVRVTGHNVPVSRPGRFFLLSWRGQCAGEQRSRARACARLSGRPLGRCGDRRGSRCTWADSSTRWATACSSIRSSIRSSSRVFRSSRPGDLAHAPRCAARARWARKLLACVR